MLLCNIEASNKRRRVFPSNILEEFCSEMFAIPPATAKTSLVTPEPTAQSLKKLQSADMRYLEAASFG
jgi:hypothetical protein